LSHPAEYGLLYGSPVPGYAAPQETVAPAAKVVLLLVDIVVDGADRLEPLPSTTIPEAVRVDLRRLIDERPGDLPEERLDRVFLAWTHLFGLLNFEIFGRLDDTINARADYFTHHMTLMADQAGLPL
jgi:hypothetical protein